MLDDITTRTIFVLMPLETSQLSMTTKLTYWSQRIQTSLIHYLWKISENYTAFVKKRKKEKKFYFYLSFKDTLTTTVLFVMKSTSFSKYLWHLDDNLLVNVFDSSRNQHGMIINFTKKKNKQTSWRATIAHLNPTDPTDSRTRGVQWELGNFF